MGTGVSYPQGKRPYSNTQTVSTGAAGVEVTGFIELLEGSVDYITVLGINSAGQLVDDVEIKITNPGKLPVVDEWTPARALFDPRNLNMWSPGGLLYATNNNRWKLEARCVASANVDVKFTFGQTVDISQ